MPTRLYRYVTGPGCVHANARCRACKHTRTLRCVFMHAMRSTDQALANNRTSARTRYPATVMHQQNAGPDSTSRRSILLNSLPALALAMPLQSSAYAVRMCVYAQGGGAMCVYGCVWTCKHLQICLSRIRHPPLHSLCSSVHYSSHSLPHTTVFILFHALPCSCTPQNTTTLFDP